MLGRITNKHIAITNEITNPIKRGINLSPIIYVFAKNKTFDAINITVIINVTPVESKRKEIFNGLDANLSNLQVKIINLLEKNK